MLAISSDIDRWWEKKARDKQDCISAEIRDYIDEKGRKDKCNACA